MNYVFSLCSKGDSRLYNRTGDIIHAFVHGEREIRNSNPYGCCDVAYYCDVRRLPKFPQNRKLPCSGLVSVAQ